MKRELPTDPQNYYWRTGRKVGRTIYVCDDGIADDSDPIIGMMDTPELAEAAVSAHNRDLAIRESR